MKLTSSFAPFSLLCFFAFMSYTNVVVAQSAQNVVWTSVVNCTVNGNSLQKTSGCNTCADAGAISQQTITSGDGYVEFTASEQTTGRMIGLSNGNPGTTATEISYGILLSTSTRASAQEHAVYKDETGYVAGDIFRIAVVGGVVKYSKNGVVFYTSAVAPTYPLLVDTSLHTLNATINNVVIGGSSNDPELPREYIDTTYPSTGTTINVDAAPYNGNLQAALDAATPGTTINLTPGATYSGNYHLRSKTNPQNLWIVLRSSSTAFNSNGSIPPNTRVNGQNSAHTGQMARILTPNSDSAIVVDDNAHHYRLVGIEVGVAPTVTDVINLITPSDTSYTSRSTMTTNIVFDRCYVHGNDNGNFRRGIAVNGNYWSVIDSYISNFHDAGSDSQALLVARGDGPFKIVNNYLEAASENVNFGGSTPPIVGLVPSDIEVRRNLFSKPLSWKNNDSVPNHSAKNLLESKSMRRALIDGNIFENNWDWTFPGDYQGQDGTAVQFLSVGRSFPEEVLCTWCVTEHVTFTNNIIRHAAGVISITGVAGGATLHVNHIKIANLLAYDIGTPTWGGPGAGTIYGIYKGVSDLQIIHTTVEGTWRTLQAEGDSNPNFVLRDNILERPSYGINSWCGSEGTPSLNCFAPYTYKKNVLVNTSDLPSSRDQSQSTTDEVVMSRYPLPYPANPFATAQTYVARHWDAVGLVDRANGNYRLASTSPYKNQGSDGKDIGADQDAIEAAINGTTGSVQNVVWTSVVNCTVNGNSLQKTSGCNTCADAGAISQQTISSGDGYVEFTASEQTTGRMIGLSNGNPGTTATEISYGILLSTSTRASAQEHAVYKDETGYVAGDIFRIAVVGGVVKYSKNGVVFYTSAVAPTYPLLVDTSLHTLNATINNVVIKTN